MQKEIPFLTTAANKGYTRLPTQAIQHLLFGRTQSALTTTNAGQGPRPICPTLSIEGYRQLVGHVDPSRGPLQFTKFNKATTALPVYYKHFDLNRHSEAFMKAARPEFDELSGARFRLDSQTTHPHLLLVNNAGLQLTSARRDDIRTTITES